MQKSNFLTFGGTKQTHLVYAKPHTWTQSTFIKSDNIHTADWCGSVSEKPFTLLHVYVLQIISINVTKFSSYHFLCLLHKSHSSKKKKMHTERWKDVWQERKKWKDKILCQTAILFELKQTSAIFSSYLYGWVWPWGHSVWCLLQQGGWPTKSVQTVWPPDGIEP